MADAIHEVAENFWNIRGSFKIAGLLDIGTQASLVRLQSGRFVMLDAYGCDDEVWAKIDELTDGGELVEAIVLLHPFHTVHVGEVHRRFPNAKMYGTDRHVKRKPDLPWEELRTSDPGLSELFDGEFWFTVPRGAALVTDDSNVHFGSVLALHRPSWTLHVDDTLSWTDLPLVGGLRFHPTLPKALEPRAGAADDFRRWANELIEECRAVYHVCTAHTKAVPRKEIPDSAAPLVTEALAKVEKVLAAHAKKYD